jgi:hypothetical protein
MSNTCNAPNNPNTKAEAKSTTEEKPQGQTNITLYQEIIKIE